MPKEAIHFLSLGTEQPQVCDDAVLEVAGIRAPWACSGLLKSPNQFELALEQEASRLCLGQWADSEMALVLDGTAGRVVNFL